jgi:4-deoxy-L-threo-5-hexosulose-uronate ketol-isomerase
MNLQPNPLISFAAALPPEELRRQFVVGGLFQPGAVNLHWWETDRTVLSAAVPLAAPLALPNDPALRSTFFLERREAGIINLGGPGTVTVDGRAYAMNPHDALYLGRGAKEVTFASAAAGQPARFWLQSYPAHAAHPTHHVVFSEALGAKLGARETSNERTLFKLIHPGAVATCQLVLGFTRLEPGSVWNSIPPHTHLRRSEVYLYFNLPPAHAVFHFMGEPSATRHVVVHDSEAVLSPPWSIHCGAGTTAYSFVWCMGGENQEFADMDPAPVAALR